MTTKKRISKHEMKEDQFVTGMFRLEEWAEANLKTILIAVGAVIVVGVAIWVYIAQSGSAERKAFDILGRAEVEMRTNQIQLAITDYEEVIDKYGSTPAASQAAFKLANLLFQTNDFVKAEQAFRRYADKYAADDTFRHSAKRGIAASLAGQARHQEAAAAFLETARVDTAAVTYEEDLFDALASAVKAGDQTLARDAFALLEKRGTSSERYRSAKITLIEKGILTYDQGEFK